MTQYRSLGILMILTVFVVTACAPDRSGSRLVTEGVRRAASENVPWGVFAEFEAPENLRRAYASALENAGLYRFYEGSPSPAEGEQAVQFRIRLRAEGEEQWKSWWYLGVGVAGPFWPIMPYRVETRLELTAELWHGGVLQRRIRLVESGETILRYYGPYQVRRVQEDTDAVHRVLIARLVAELGAERMDNPETCGF